MNRKEVMSFMLEVEQIFPVDEWALDKVHIWPLIRVQLAFRIDDSLNNRGRAFGNRYKTNSARLKAYSIYRKVISRVSKTKQNIFSRYYVWRTKIDKRTNFNKARVLILNFSHYRIFFNHKWYSKFTDPLVDYFKSQQIPCLTLEFTDSVAYQTNRYNEDSIVNYIHFLKVNLPQLKNESELNISLKKYDDFLNFAESRLDEDNIKYLQVDSIIQQTKYLLALKENFKQLLLNSQAKLVFLVNYYEIKGMALCAACDELKIPSIDLQHGIQGDIHIAYGNWSKIASKGFSTLPTTFWNWNQNQASSIDKWAKCSHKHSSLVGGNLYLQKSGESEESKSDRDKLELKKIKDADTVNILFTLQPFEDCLGNRFFKVYQNSPKNWRWLFRLHPRQSLDEPIVELLKHKYEITKSEIDFVSKCPLNTLLKQIDLHVTQFSSVVLEAEHFGIPSVCLHSNSLNLFKAQINSGIAIYASKESEILACIKSQLSFERNLEHKNVDYQKQIEKLVEQYQVI